MIPFQLNRQLLLLRRAWDDRQAEVMPAVYFSLAFSLLLALLPTIPWVLKAVLAGLSAAGLVWIYHDLSTHLRDHPELADDEEVIPLEGLAEDDPEVWGRPEPVLGEYSSPPAQGDRLE